MKTFVIKYMAVVGCTLFLFMNFVACGSQFYKASLEDDHDKGGLSTDSSDPDSPSYGIHALNGWPVLPIPFKVGSEITAEQETQLVKAMRTWEKSVGKVLFSYKGIHAGKTGDDFHQLYDSLKDTINGNYLSYDWTKTQKPKEVLATTIWNTKASDHQAIDTADIRFNGNYYVIGDSLILQPDGEKEVVDMESLALHELGHLLGLGHVSPDIDSYSIMNPSLFIGSGLTSRKLSRGDIERIQKVYKCTGEACDIESVLISFEYGDEESEEEAAH